MSSIRQRLELHNATVARARTAADAARSMHNQMSATRSRSWKAQNKTEEKASSSPQVTKHVIRNSVVQFSSECQEAPSRERERVKAGICDEPVKSYEQTTHRSTKYLDSGLSSRLRNEQDDVTRLWSFDRPETFFRQNQVGHDKKMSNKEASTMSDLKAAMKMEEEARFEEEVAKKEIQKLEKMVEEAKNLHEETQRRKIINIEEATKERENIETKLEAAKKTHLEAEKKVVVEKEKEGDAKEEREYIEKMLVVARKKYEEAVTKRMLEEVNEQNARKNKMQAEKMLETVRKNQIELEIKRKSEEDAAIKETMKIEQLMSAAKKIQQEVEMKRKERQDAVKKIKEQEEARMIEEQLRLETRAHLTNKLRLHLQGFNDKVHRIISENEKEKSTLKDAKSKINEQLILYQQIKSYFSKQKNHVDSQTVEIKTYLSTFEDNGTPDIKDLAIPSDVYSRQLLELSAADSSIEDCLFYIDMAVQMGRINVDTYMKLLHTLARKQFFIRAKGTKINRIKAYSGKTAPSA